MHAASKDCADQCIHRNDHGSRHSPENSDRQEKMIFDLTEHTSLVKQICTNVNASSACFTDKLAVNCFCHRLSDARFRNNLQAHISLR